MYIHVIIINFMSKEFWMILKCYVYNFIERYFLIRLWVFIPLFIAVEIIA